MKAKSKAAPLARERPQIKEPTDSLPAMAEPVKAVSNELRALRLTRNLAAKDMVAEVRTLYPKYDKTIQSKAERSEDYGIQLMADAMRGLKARFAPDLLEAEKRPHSDRHRLAHRITCRLTEDDYRLLQQRLRREGRTIQDWLAGLVRQYLNERSKTHDQEPQ